MRRDQKEALRRLTDEHDELMENTKDSYKLELAEQAESYEAIIGMCKSSPVLTRRICLLLEAGFFV